MIFATRVRVYEEEPLKRITGATKLQSLKLAKTTRCALRGRRRARHAPSGYRASLLGADFRVGFQRARGEAFRDGVLWKLPLECFKRTVLRACADVYRAFAFVETLLGDLCGEHVEPDTTGTTGERDGGDEHHAEAARPVLRFCSRARKPYMTRRVRRTLWSFFVKA